MSRIPREATPFSVLMTPEQANAQRIQAEYRQQVKRAQEQLRDLPIAKRKEGIFGMHDLENIFTIDGAIKLKEDPRRGIYGAFFKKEGRIFEHGARIDGHDRFKEARMHILRGARYATALDLSTDYKQKVTILAQDFTEALSELTGHRHAFHQKNLFVQQQALLDYAKNSAVTLFNALIIDEQKGNLRLEDEKAAEYKSHRASLQNVVEKAVFAQYAHLAGHRDAVAHVEDLRRLIPSIEKSKKFLLSLRRTYSDRLDTIKMRELTHPISVGASALYTAELGSSPIPDVIIGLPSGGTEYAFALQYAYFLKTGRKPRVVCLPLSLHNNKKNNADALSEASLADPAVVRFLKAHEIDLNGKNVMLADDNASTGNTLDTLKRSIDQYYSMPNEVSASVAQADLRRMAQLSRGAVKKGGEVRVAQPPLLKNAASIAGVSSMFRRGTPLATSLSIERIRQAAREKFSTNPFTNLVYIVKEKNISNPTMRILEHVRDRKNKGEISDVAVIDQFEIKKGAIWEHGILSNFSRLEKDVVYSAPVSFADDGITVSERTNPRRFPTSEHAYQAAKFIPRDLGRLSRNKEGSNKILAQIRSLLKYREDLDGRLTSDILNPSHEKYIFSDEYYSPAEIKRIARILSMSGLERPEWNDVRLSVMAEVLIKKFEDPVLRQKLLDTGDAVLAEVNEHGDTYWGIALVNGRYVGSNFLGLLLMEVREHYRNPPKAKNGAK